MERYNHTYLDSFYAARGLVMINFCMSATAVVQNSLGVQTYVAMLSFLVLLSGKMCSTYTVGTMSLEEERAFQCLSYDTQNLQYSRHRSQGPRTTG
jgi:hypothetical protein